MAEEFRVLRPYEYHSQLIAKGKRADGRELEQFRDIKLEIDAIRTADSSSLVKLGNTSLVCGCTVQKSKFTENVENDEEIKIKIELPPVCSSPYGKRTQNTAQLLTKTLKDILNDMRCIDKSSLHIEDSEDTFWSVNVEVICLNYDGCLLDTAIIAVLSALKTLELKSTDMSEDRKVKFNTTPVTSSFAIIGDEIICDPNLEEESIAQSTYSITVDNNLNQNYHIDKVGGKSISSEILFKCLEICNRRAKVLLSLLDGLNKDKKMDVT